MYHRTKFRFKTGAARNEFIDMLSVGIAQAYQGIWESVDMMTDEERASHGEGTTFERLRPQVGVVDLTYDSLDRRLRLYDDVVKTDWISRRQLWNLLKPALYGMIQMYEWVPNIKARPCAGDMVIWAREKLTLLEANVKINSATRMNDWAIL